MKNVGIIAEYHPFHNGHEAQIAQLRQMGAEKIIVAMSTETVQRGQLALLPARVRAEAALRCGADMVVALPAPYACATAEKFAQAGVALLAALGADTLAFGAESGSPEQFMELAQLLISPDLRPLLKEQLATGQTFAAARQKAVEQQDPVLSQLLGSPNNILGTEYSKAILQQGCAMDLLPLPRRGTDHDSDFPEPPYASASYLRRLAAEADSLDGWAPYVPEDALELYQKAWAQGEFCQESRAEIAILSRLRAVEVEQLRKIRGVSEGLENRLMEAIRISSTMEQLLGSLKTKRYPMARLRRLVLDAALGCTENLPALPPYLWVLGAKQEALPLLKNAALPAGTSLAKLEKLSPEAAIVVGAECAAADLAALCRKQPQPMGGAQTQKPVVLL